MTSQSSAAVRASSDAWFAGLGRLIRVLEMTGYSTQISMPQPVKIAILDTGLTSRYRKEVPPARYHYFVDPSQKECQDTAGHGTKMFKVLRRVYSKAEIYVGRVFETSQASTQTADLMEKVIIGLGCFASTYLSFL